MNTIQAIRQSGNKVRVIHERYLENSTELKPLYVIREQKLQDWIQPRGGKTTVQATLKDGRNFSAVAFCSTKDNFNHKLGLAKAIGRLTAKIEANLVD